MKFQYAITKELLQAFLNIVVLEEKLKSLPLDRSLQASLFQEAKVKTSHFSGKIEGNCLTLKQSEDLAQGKRVDAPAKDIQEIKNLFELFAFLESGPKTSAPLKSNFVCTLHKLVEKNIVKGKLLGHYREAQNAVFDATTGDIVYLPPEAKDVETLMLEFFQQLNHNRWEHELIRAAVTHFGLVTIHPFMDGNGRTARALSTFLLLKSAFLFPRYIPWDEYFYHHRRQYYQLLHDAQGDNFYERKGIWDLQRWLEFFVYGVEEILQSFLEKMGGEMEIHSLSDRQKRGLHFLKKKQQMTNKDYRRLNNISNFTALMDLRDLENRGLIRKLGKGRAVRYLLK